MECLKRFNECMYHGQVSPAMALTSTIPPCSPASLICEKLLNQTRGGGAAFQKKIWGDVHHAIQTQIWDILNIVFPGSWKGYVCGRYRKIKAETLSFSPPCRAMPFLIAATWERDSRSVRMTSFLLGPLVPGLSGKAGSVEKDLFPSGGVNVLQSKA